MRVLLGLICVLLLAAGTGCVETIKKKKEREVAAAKAAAEKKKAADAKKGAPEQKKDAAKAGDKGKPADANDIVAPVDNGLPRDATGSGADEDLAKKGVLRDAHQQVKKLMDAKGLTSFVVTDDFLTEKVLALPGQAGKPEIVKVNEVDRELKTWVVAFRTDTQWFSEIERRDHDLVRKARGETRQTLTLHVMIGLSVLLLAGFGYVRLDEYTQRRYTTWLRLAGVGLATSLVAGWWWVFIQPPG